MIGFPRRRAESRRPAWLLATLFACAVAVLTVDAVGAGRGAQSPSAKDLFQQARHQEDAVGNLDAAIQIYRRTLAASPDRALAANAQLRIGLCLEKLGRAAEARQAFEIVVRDYGNQSVPAAEAKAHLARQSPPAAATLAGTGVEAVQLWSGNDIEGDAALSPDGRYLVYSSWAENGNLLLKDLTTGAVKLLTRDSAVRTNGAPQPWSPIFSPDGSRVAFPWYESRRADPSTSLRVVDRDGANPRTLISGSNVDLVYDWSPDGRSIALNLYTTGQSRIAIASVADGSISPLKTTGWQKALGVRFSPDGRFLTYSVQVAQGDAEPAVFVIAADGSSEATLSEGSSPAWTPDGRSVVFFSTRSGTSDLWMMPVVNGKSAGAASILRRSVSGTNHGFIRDGSLFYETRSQGRDLVVAAIDPAAGRAMEPVNLTNAFVGSNGGGVWSPDGRQVAFARGTDRLATKIVIRTVATGEERILPAAFGDGLFLHTHGIRWISDGRALLVRDRGNGRVSFKRIDINTGSQEVIFDAPMAAWSRGADVSRDGRTLFYTHRNDLAAQSIQFRVVKRDLATGQESEVYRPAGTGALDLAVSPDGTQLAVNGLQSGGLVVVPVAGGAPVEIQQGTDRTRPLAWTRDGRHILGVRSTSDEIDHLWALPVSGGAAVDLSLSAESILHVSVSRTDGRVLVSIMRPSHELWLVRNLLKSPTAR